MVLFGVFSLTPFHKVLSVVNNQQELCIYIAPVKEVSL